MQCAISHWHQTIWAHAFNSIKIFTIRRYPALVAVSSGTLLLTAAFAVSMAVLASRYGHERDAAKIERTRAEQVSGFLSEMLTGADPNTAQGRKLTALDLLDCKRSLQPGGVKMCGHRCIAGRRLKRSCSELNRNEDFAYAF